MNAGYVVTKDDGTEEVYHIPYNINNRMVTEEDLMELLLQNNVKVDKIHNLKPFHLAFTHPSYTRNRNVFPEKVLEDAKEELGNPDNLVEIQDQSYERIEFLGDRVIKLITSHYLYKRYPNEDEGFMTRLQTKIEDKTGLAQMSKKIGLGKFFIISKQIENLNGRLNDKIHEDIFESFMGALFESNGFEPCCLLFVNLLETIVDYSEKLYCDNNYKDILLRYYHSNKWKYPKYYLINSDGPSHKKQYIMGVEKGSNEDLSNKSLKEKCIGFGVGSSKKEGEQMAAKMALISYGYLNEDQYDNDDIYYPDWNELNEEENEDIETLLSLEDAMEI